MTGDYHGLGHERRARGPMSPGDLDCVIGQPATASYRRFAPPRHRRLGRIATGLVAGGWLGAGAPGVVRLASGGVEEVADERVGEERGFVELGGDDACRATERVLGVGPSKNRVPPAVYAPPD